MADEEQINSDNDPGVEEIPQTDPPKQQKTASSHEHRNQWILFGILAGILIGTVLVIAVLRPLIFDRIVPAVMGDFVTPTVIEEAAPVDGQTEKENQMVEETTPTDETDVVEENQVFIPAASGGNEGGGAPAPVEENAGELVEGETPVAPQPDPEPRTHTVQAGENLTKISQQYGVSIPEIMAANNLPSADYISVGQILIIPAN